MAKTVSPGVQALRKVVEDVYADARKAKAEGLTEEEILERDRLRREYIAAFRENLVAELENTYIVDARATSTS